MRRSPFLLLLTLLALLGTACGNDADPPPAAAPDTDTGTDVALEGTLTVYSGRSEELVGPLLEMFEEDTGIEVEARYGDTAEMAGAILEEGDNSPADVFFGQDAGALGALSSEGRLTELDDSVLDAVDEEYRAADGEWVGVSARSRVVVYNTDAVAEDELPDSVLSFTDERWSGRLGWAPTNGSFQAFVTGMRVIEGEDTTREWLEGIQANGVEVFENNSSIVEAVAAGEIDAGFVNHYYLFQLGNEGAPVEAAANYYFPDGDAGGLVNVAGAGIIDTSDDADLAAAFVEYLLGPQAQEYFASETFEIPLVDGTPTDPAVPELVSFVQPGIDLNDLEDLEGTLALLNEAGVL